MPPRDLRTCLHDILTAGERIVEVTSNIPLDRYKADWVLRAAVERQLEIIGEAMSRAVKIDTAVIEQITDARPIIAFRNQIIHGYDIVDHDIVWGIIKEYLPRLLKEAASIRNSMRD